MPAEATIPQSEQKRSLKGFQPGNRLNPQGRPKRVRVSHSLPQLVTQPKEKHNEVLLLQAYELAVRQGYDLIVDLSKSGKKNFNEIRNRMISWGVAADKILQRDQESGLTIRIPSALVGRLSGVLALKLEPVQSVNTSQPVTVVDNQNQDTPNTTKLLDKSYQDSVHK